MKTAQEMKEFTLLRRTKVFEELSDHAGVLARGPIAYRIKQEANKGHNRVTYQVSEKYNIHLVREELRRWGYKVRIGRHRTLIIRW